MATKTSVGSGLWSAVGTWDTGVPLDNDVVIIAAGHTVEFDVDQSGFANGIDGLTITGTLKLTRTAGTYYLKIKAAKWIGGAGTFDCGTSVSPIPFVSKHTITGGEGWYIKGNDGSGLILTVYASEPAIKYVKCTAVEAIGSTILEVDTDVTGDIWADGNEVRIDNVNRNNQSETRTIAVGGISANSITITAGLTNAKIVGTMILLITRNVRFICNGNHILISFLSTNLSVYGGEFVGHSSYYAINTSAGTVGGGTFSGFNSGVRGSGSLKIVGGVWSGNAYHFNTCQIIKISGGIFTGAAYFITGSSGVQVSNVLVCGTGTAISSGIGNVIFSGTFIGNGYVLDSNNAFRIYGGLFDNNNIGIRYSQGLIYNSQFINGGTDLYQSFVNCWYSLFSSGSENAFSENLSNFLYSTSEDHDQVLGAFKSWTQGAISEKQSVIIPIGYSSSIKTVLRSSAVEGYWQKEITVGPGASVNISMNLRKSASMVYLPRVIVFNKASTDPFAGGAGLYTFTMTDSIDTWEDDLYTYTNSGTEDVTLVIRCQGMNATGNMYSALDIEQINVDLTSATALINAIKAKTDQVEDKLDIVDGIVDAVKLTTDALPAAVAPANEYDVALAAIQADLDNPNQYKADVSGIPAAVWGHATRTLSSFGTLVADIWSYITRTITAFAFTVATNSDANVSAIKIKTDNLPTLPAATGDPMTLTSGERTAIANEVESQIINETDAERVLTAITDKIASVNPSLDDLTLAGIASAVRTELGTELARIDAAISSRLATSGYTAPANADVAAIKIKTDNLPIDPADQSILAALIAGLPAAPSEADIITALKASVFDGLLTFEDSIKLYNAILFGKLDGGGSGTLKFRDPADTKDRVTAVVDLSNGDRDDITLDIT